MDLQLGGKRALVTGSSSGIGEETARLLVGEGARVVVHGRNRERAERIAAEIGAAGVAIGDLSIIDEVEAVYGEARAALGGNIEVLINNAGGSTTNNATRAPADTPIEDYVTNFRSNTLGAIRLCQLAVPEMVAARFGRIVNVSSAVATQPNALGADYSAAKSALNNFTVSLAGSLKGVNVTANVLQPGMVMADGLLRYGREKYGDSEMSIDSVTQRLAADGVFDLPPVGRLGTPRDLAFVACMLASPMSGFVSGANYRVDGGMVRGLN
ncbi:SDR family NAD(P)-dependent oxidoreductase [Novosphingobium sp. G106]|uniref:SDR family NAD(P)-dependent oxidoreductase n=1 Tax=Novosphingobium sp. G106 TaxID=2849500 RepID=UPI001C2D04C5|nr:SDR family NAD(P)-dependent oxidoreductase [Novosphingobium sp. G106]MBV1688842.1 SDR family NAD(P)-dependent oxidoreductase [Novosphingobium sp. G106]